MKEDSGGLQRFIELAIEKKMCTQIHCTTCGAREFRQELWSAIGGRSKGELGPMFANARALAELMGGPKRKTGYTYEYEQAVRLMLVEIWPFLGSEQGESELELMLLGSWAGEVLARMKAHWVVRHEAHHTHSEREANAPRRRGEKKRQGAEQNAARLAAKVERHRLWREKNKAGR